MNTRKTLQVAVVGSGPSGFYAAEALLRSAYSVAVDVYEKLPVPFGLVRFGVAPDHPKLKQVVKVFDRIAQMEGFRFIGNVCVGRDVSVETLRQHYHAVIFACGAECERDLGIPGESLPGSHSAREFVAWYNGHPEYRHLNFDFSCERAVVIGQGNVALDVARILCKTATELRGTDIADYALAALAESKVKRVHVVGRRGPVQAKFTDKELREFGELADCTALVSPDYLRLNAASREELQAGGINASNNMELLHQFTGQPERRTVRTCHFDFFQSPIALHGTNRVEALTLRKNNLAGDVFCQRAVAGVEKTTLECGLVFRCIGYRAAQIQGLCYNERTGVLSNREGRVRAEKGFMRGVYATGWIKRGPSGTIGSNRGDSVETVMAVLADRSSLLTEGKRNIEQLHGELSRGGCRLIDYAGWKKIDARETELGASAARPRSKFTTVPDMLAAAQG